MEILSKIIIWIVLLGSLWAIIKYTKKIDAEFKEWSPKSNPYVWGYLMGILYFMFGIAILCLFIHTFLNKEADLIMLPISLIPVYINIAIGIKVINRSEKAFMIATVFTLNPIIWVINYFYMKNRYDDFH